jgi:S-adenosylmethionine decarboxylase
LKAACRVCGLYRTNIKGREHIMRECTSAALDHDTILDSGKIGITRQWPVFVNTPEEGVTLDHFVEVDGEKYAGTHIIADFWEVARTDNLEYMESALRRAVEAAGATLLHIHLHHFTPGGGISGVAVLAESHISVHTWPEREFAAFDIFMCGSCRPEKGLAVLENAFSPGRTDIKTYIRGRVESHEDIQGKTV